MHHINPSLSDEQLQKQNALLSCMIYVSLLLHTAQMKKLQTSKESNLKNLTTKEKKNIKYSHNKTTEKNKKHPKRKPTCQCLNATKKAIQP